MTPALVAKVGHVRAFSVLAAFAANAMLGSLLWVNFWNWIVLRSLSGFCFAGAAMIVESWMNERTPFDTRAQVATKDKVSFASAPMARNSTPQTMTMSVGAHADAEAGPDVPGETPEPVLEDTPAT